MGQYKANATNSKNFSLTFENQIIGELIYKEWYSFNAEILISNGAIWLEYLIKSCLICTTWLDKWLL